MMVGPLPENSSLPLPLIRFQLPLEPCRESCPRTIFDHPPQPLPGLPLGKCLSSNLNLPPWVLHKLIAPFVYLCDFLVSACRIFSCGTWTLSCDIWDLDPLLEIEPGPPALVTCSLSLWTPREVPSPEFFEVNAISAVPLILLLLSVDPHQWLSPGHRLSLHPTPTPVLGDLITHVDELSSTSACHPLDFLPSLLHQPASLRFTGDQLTTHNHTSTEF